jgi:hypothetical protein
MTTQISEHFTLEELTTTSFRQYDNTPGEAEVVNLTLLANEQLEAIRTLWDCPIHVNSAFRSIEVNAAVGGTAKSQHTQGCAADIIPVGNMTLRQAYEAILDSGIPFDQLIFEQPRANGGWIHISRPNTGNPYRKQALMYGPFSSMKYVSYDPTKIA